MHNRFLVQVPLLPRKTLCFFSISVVVLAILSELTGFDALAASLVQQSATAQMHFWKVVTIFGLSGYMFAVSGTISIFSLVLSWQTQDEEKSEKLKTIALRSAYFFGCIAVSGIVAQTCKHMLGRSRPRFLTEGGPRDFHPMSWHSGWDSFPSGHTTSAFAAALALGLLSSRLRVPALLVALLIGLSRIATGAHYPSDVLAGMLLGTAVSLGLAWWLGKRRLIFRISE